MNEFGEYGFRWRGMYSVLAGLSGFATPDPTGRMSYPKRTKGGSFKANKRKAAKRKGGRR